MVLWYMWRSEYIFVESVHSLLHMGSDDGTQFVRHPEQALILAEPSSLLPSVVRRAPQSLSLG